MWRDITRRLLIHFGLIRCPDLLVRFVDQHPARDEVNDGELVVVRDGNRTKWSCLRCPGGCGDNLQLALSPHRSPCWLIRFDWLCRPSITPSIRQLNHCRCHFWVTKGIVYWCADSLAPVSSQTRTPDGTGIIAAPGPRELGPVPCRPPPGRQSHANPPPAQSQPAPSPTRRRNRHRAVAAAGDPVRQPPTRIRPARETTAAR